MANEIEIPANKVAWTLIHGWVQLLLVHLKVTNAISIGWAWIMLPIIIPTIIVSLYAIFSVIFYIWGRW